MIDHDLPVDSTDSEPAGAPADEIEITPAMIAAGLRAFVYCNEDYGSLEDGIVAIFTAMYREMEIGL